MPDHRAATLTQILEQLPELTDPVRAGNGEGQTWLRLMPHERSCRIRDWKPPRCTCSLQSAVEVWRLLHLMRDSTEMVELPDGTPVAVRSLWSNVNLRYLRCATSTRELGWRSGSFVGLGQYAQVVAQPNGWQLALAKERTRRRRAGTVIRVRVVTWDPSVQRVQLDRAVQWLSANWALPSEPRLPREKMAA